MQESERARTQVRFATCSHSRSIRAGCCVRVYKGAVPGIPVLFKHRRYQHRSLHVHTNPMDFARSLSVADYERTQQAAKANFNYSMGKAVLPGCTSYYMGDKICLRIGGDNHRRLSELYDYNRKLMSMVRRHKMVLKR